MKTGRITDRTARAAFEVDALVAVEREEETARMERLEVELLLAEVDRELVAEQRAAVVRVDRSFTDAHRAWRASRRAGREALRALPGRFDAAEYVAEEAA
ncbi:hypothetical protein ACQPZU_01865 [Saccharomonospora azurea]|uniref:hypothetical protein n=1 Tax=Saccharomonospora azurea TaxID=40988 RepID=UPI003D8F251F